MTEKISIIIPAYNAEMFIERAVASALNQSYNNVEILVINDGAVDATKEIVEGLMRDHSCIQLHNTENYGVSHARNVGLQNATGDYVMFLDADDELLPESAFVLLSCAKKHNLDIVSGKFFCVYDEGEAPQDDGTIVVYTGSEGLLRSIQDYPETYSACAKLYRRAAIAGARFPEGKKVHEDSFFLFKCLEMMPTFGVYDRYVYKCYLTKGSASRGAFSEKVFDILSLAEEKKQIIEEFFPQYKEYTRLMMLKANMSLLSSFLKTNDTKYRKMEKDCINRIIRNKDCFIPAIPSDKRWFWIITNHLYPLYKVVYRIRKRLS